MIVAYDNIDLWIYYGLLQLKNTLCGDYEWLFLINEYTFKLISALLYSFYGTDAMTVDFKITLRLITITAGEYNGKIISIIWII